MHSFSMHLPEHWAYLLQRIGGIFTVTEAALAALVLLLAVAAPGVGRSFFARVEQAAGAVLHNPVRQLLAIAVLAVLARAVLLPWLGPPVLIFEDEHSLMLQAQTFVEGRLVNPPPPFWKHFEAIHINIVPTYTSMYFPGRGLPMAVGLFLADNAWIGIWLAVIAMSVAAVWMLQGWVTLPFAFLGGVLVVLRLGTFSYWINAYWGGAFTAVGGMLVLGAMPRWLREPGWANGGLMGLGALILMISRPFEGMLFCLPIGIVILVRLLRSRKPTFAKDFMKVFLPVAGCVAIGGAAMLAYNKAATDDPLLSPYELNRAMYATAPAFLSATIPSGEKLGPPYFREFYKWERNFYDRRNNPRMFLLSALGKIYDSWYFYVGFIVTPAFLAGIWALRREYEFFFVGAVFYLGYAFETWNFPHYTAPVFSIFLVFTMKGFEWLRSWRPAGRDCGLFLTRGMPAATLLTLSVPASAVITGWPVLVSNQHNKPCCALKQSTHRSEITAKLDALPGRDLVLVAGENYPVHEAMVYNEPDIADAPIIWANRLGPEQDAPLIAHFPGRILWDLEWNKDGSYKLTRRSRPER